MPVSVLRRTLLFAASAAVLGAGLLAQPVFRGTEIFPPEEYAARRAKVIEQIGDGVAVMLGKIGRASCRERV